MNANLKTRLPPKAEMERAYLTKDAAYNGLFFLGVRTTGIFCRPTCPARKPLPKNVEYFRSAQGALAAGYRPCKRCKPLAADDQPAWAAELLAEDRPCKRCKPLAADDQPAWAAELLAEVERRPTARITEGDLRGRGIDPATARRYFRRQYGMTFQAFARARRLAGALT